MTNEHKNTPAGQLQERINVLEEALRDASCQIEEKVQALSLLRRVVEIAGHVVNLDEFYRAFIDVLIQETNAVNCSLMAIDEISGRLVIKAARGRNDDGSCFDINLDSAASFAVGEGIAGIAAQQREMILVDDVLQDKRFHERESLTQIRSILCAPIVFSDEVFGVVNVSHYTPAAFSENSMRVMEIICPLVSTIIGNAHAHLNNEKRFRSMFANIAIAIVIVKAGDFSIVDCNTYMEKCFGYTRAELLQKGSIFEIIKDGDHALLREKLPGLNDIANGNTVIELELLKKDAATAIAEVTVSKAQYLEHDVLRFTFNDVSEKKKLIHQLLQTEKLKSLGELAGGVAHDFNNVLAAILGRIQLLRMIRDGKSSHDDSAGSLDEAIDKNLTIIEQAAQDGADTVRRIQEFAGGHDQNRLPVSLDISLLLADALELTSVRWKHGVHADNEQVVVRRELPEQLMVLGVASELREVFVNLIINALDAMNGTGQLWIKAFINDSDVVVQLRDSGPGISPEDSCKIFDPFFTTKGVASTGLGLSVSYGIIKRHAGSITVENHSDGGALFTITLPRAGSDSPHALLSAIESRKPQILLVEDEENVSETICDILIFSDFDVTVRDNGRSALEAFNSNTFDLVLTDLGLPGLSGFEVAGEIKSLRPDIPVILVTGWKLEVDEEELRARGVDFLINKPFQLKKIIATVQEALSLHSK